MGGEKKYLNCHEGDAEEKKKNPKNNMGELRTGLSFLGISRSGEWGLSSPSAGAGPPRHPPVLFAARFSCEPHRSSLYRRGVECLAN